MAAGGDVNMSASRLLIVDDEADFAAFVSRVATECGYESVAVADAGAVPDHLVSWCPDLIILDLQMPGTDGIQLLRELARTAAKVKVLLASGVDERVLDTARQLGTEAGLEIVGALLKPVRAVALRRQLEAAKMQDSPIEPVDVDRAVGQKELNLHYQPRLDGKLGRVIGAETLVRWVHPSRGMLLPAQFIPVLEGSRAIDALTDWVLDTALRQAGLWRRNGCCFDISVNVSARNLHDLDLPDRIANLCDSHGVPPKTLTIELTETATMQDAGCIMDVLTRLRLKGFGLAIDDFGTGYSSLVQLRRLPFSEVKIDKSFVSDMLTSKDSAVIVRTIIAMARNLGIEPAAEGVENKITARELVKQGCHIMQGYWISRPLPAEDFQAFIDGYVPTP